MKRYLSRLFLPLGVVAVLLAHVAGYVSLPYVDGLERQLYDSRIRLTAPGGTNTDIVIVAIDETSLEQEGHWPWTRDKLARLVDRLYEYGAAWPGWWTACMNMAQRSSVLTWYLRNATRARTFPCCGRLRTCPRTALSCSA
jgi:hypothetical protein